MYTILCLLVCAMVSSVRAGTITEKLKAAQRDASKELVKMRHEYPELQPRVYAVLDHVSTLYQTGLEATKKVKTQKQMAKQEQARALQARKETVSLKKERDNLKEDRELASNKQSTAVTQMQDLMRERDQLREQLALMQEKAQSQADRVRALEDVVGKTAAVANNKNENVSS